MASVIVNGARTPMGRLLGNLKDVPATRLGSVAIQAALDRSGVAPEQVQYVIMGQVLQAGAGQMSARQAAVGAGIPMAVPSLTINKVCLSGLDAIALADQLIRAGEFDIIVAGGMESMTNAPHLLRGQRQGYKYGDVTMVDHMALDGLTDAYDGLLHGGVDRPAQPQARHRSGGAGRLRRAQPSARRRRAEERRLRRGDHSGRDSPAQGRAGRDQPRTRAYGRDTTLETLAKLRPAFAADGTITAGTSSPISDGACAVVVDEQARRPRSSG